MKSILTFIYRAARTLLSILLILQTYHATAADCSYQTVAGPSVTFRGDGVPVSQALFNSPGSIAASADGSIYVADTNNNRVRLITADGQIRTVAGTGSPSFGGDGGPAVQAALNQPNGLALGKDGTLYVSDTSNQRVRAIGTDGVIHTVAGEGHARFSGDGGPAISASLNQPTALSLDQQGRLLILDSWNYRVRRVGLDGTITTVAGSQGRDDYNVYPPCCEPAPAPAAGATVPLYAPFSMKMGPDGSLYLSDELALRRLDPAGTLTTFILYAPEQTITAAIPVSALQIYEAIPIPLNDGSLVLLTSTQSIRIVNGTAAPFQTAPSYILNADPDPSTGGLITLGTGGRWYTPIIQRLSVTGASTLVYQYSPLKDPSTVGSPLNLDPGFQAMAVGPDQTIYLAQGSQILEIPPNGKISVIPLSLGTPISMAVDSKANLYVAFQRASYIQKISPAGVKQIVYQASLGVTGIRFDAQDNLYVFSPNPKALLIRLDTNFVPTTIVGNLPVIFETYFDTSGVKEEPMAVTPDGSSVYLGFIAFFESSPSQIFVASPGVSSLFTTLPMERRVYPTALALTPAGDLYAAAGSVYRILDGGAMVTVQGGDQFGFWGEHGYDSEPGTSYTGDLVADNQNGLLALDLGYGSLRRISLAGCPDVPQPSITTILESATGNSMLPLAAGQLFSIYGQGMGPANGSATAFDNTGHLPTTYSGTQVTINGLSAPLVYVSSHQVNAVVPFDLAGQQPARISVSSGGVSSDVVTSRIANYAPALFSYTVDTLVTPNYYAVMLNEDGSVNAMTNPAKLGSIVTVYATGVGATMSAGDDGKLAALPLKTPLFPVTMQVQGQTISPLYAGTAPGEVEGLTQINFRLPSTLPFVAGPSAFIRIEMGSGVPGPSPRDLSFYFTP